MNRKVERGKRGKRKLLLLTTAMLLLGSSVANAQAQGKVKIGGNIFGGGEAASVTGNTTVDIHGTDRDTVIGSVFGGGEGKFVAGLNDNATAVKSTVNLSNGNVMTNLYGGGKGDDIHPNLARVVNSEVNISDNGKVHGNVYGGGDMASVGTLNSGGTAFEEGTGLAKVIISGGRVGDPQANQTDNQGYVFGGGRGFAGGKNSDGNGKNALLFANVDSTKVTISGTAEIISSVFGGGDNGHVWRSTVVKMLGGIVGQKNSLAEYITDELEHTATHIYTGNILGGGRGIDMDATHNYNDTTGIVFGNTNVIMEAGKVRHAVYGGGGLSPVGTFTVDNNGVHTFQPNTGKTYVSVSGGLVGPTVEDLTQATEAEYQAFFGAGTTVDLQRYTDTAFKYLGGNNGWVFGAGCGLAGSEYANLTFNDSAVVNISGTAQVVGSVFGGGENGHVQGHTKVTVSGGTIGGIPLHGDTLNDISTYHIVGGEYDNVTVHLSKKDAELKENEYGVGRHIFRGEVYGGGKGTDYITSANQYSLTAGRVYGNTNVIVKGNAKIYNRVYGGGSLASVGTYTADPTGVTEYALVSGGTASVTISGGQIGSYNDAITSEGRNNGDVFGGGRGIVGKSHSQAVSLAYVGNTIVTIEDDAAIASSVYGGAANGHVQENSYVNVTGGTIGTEGLYGWHSNVYGGGGGTARYKDGNKPEHLSITSGRVFGNAKVKIEGGTIYNNVYGGGAIASVGTYDLSANATDTIIANTAIDTVLILGGNIGYDGGQGNVFGSGRGLACAPNAYLDSLSYAAQTRVIIGSKTGSYNPVVKGSVYGSGENGHVFHDAIVRVLSGTVKQNVFGAGMGTDRYNNDTTSYNPIAGIAQSTEVTIEGGVVEGEVFGGGEMAMVLKLAKVEVSGGTVGVATNIQQSVNDKGSVYGGSLGKPNAAYKDFATVGRTDVDIKGGHVVNSVFGGGKNGNVLANTDVTVSDDGLVGIPLTLKQRTADANGQVVQILSGNVYGGGRGSDLDGNNQYSPTAGLVRGNTFVTVSGGTVRHAVYGGGALGSVGTFNTDANTDTITEWLSGGKATVTVNGGIIGPTLADLTADATKVDSAFLYLGNNEGNVYGSSRGMGTPSTSTLAFTKETSVNIETDAEVIGGVFGGGENGHVYANTEVVVSGGTIGGMPLHEGENYTVPEGLYKDQVVSLAESESEIYEDEYGVGRRIFRGSVFGGGRGTDSYNDLTTTPPQFGLFEPTAGRVFGNTKVTISGGKIYNNVYGGGTIASVGKFKYDGTVTDSVVGIISGGKAEVIIEGGQIGTDGKNNGDVYGGGLGVAVPPQVQLTHLAYVGSTEVSVTDGIIKSNVYGGPASGHVQGDTKVTISGGTIGYTYEDNGETKVHGAWHSNVFGGGGGANRYDLPNGQKKLSISAGRVYGNTEVNIETGANILHNVYGGGAVASVGTYDLSGVIDPLVSGTGVATININGGTIGLDGNENGHVFGSGRGNIDTIGAYPDSLSYVGYSYVNIGKNEGGTLSGSAKINGSVYGSGENGHVFQKATINVYKGTIGCTPDEYTAMVAEGHEGRFAYRGNVYGAGCGTDTMPNGKYNPQAGIVWGTTEVNIHGGYISRNVYGGGAMASVGNHTATLRHKTNNAQVGDTISWPAELNFLMGGTAEVNVTGGHIGTLDVPGLSGDVYGSSRGEAGDRYTFASLANVKKAYVTVNFTPTTGTIDDDTENVIVGSVYGSGENGHVYDTTSVTITDGLVMGSVFGGGKGVDTYKDWLKDPNDDHLYKTDVRSVTAGKVYGNTSVTVNNGVIKQNVYGGGNMASVGKGNYNGYGEDGNFNNVEQSGRTWVAINGGTIGSATWTGTEDNGHVFGSSKGTTFVAVTQTPRYNYSRDFFLGYTNQTFVTIGSTSASTSPVVYGSVFGGGENGHVRLNTEVVVNKGDVGTEYISGDITSHQWKHRGNVYGAGRGIDKIGTTDDYCTSAGSVTRNTHVTINGGTIHRDVYGGGSLATVGPPPGYEDQDPSITIVDIKGGTIGDNTGVTNQYGGNVYGSSRGEIAAPNHIFDVMATVKQAIVNIGVENNTAYNPLVNASVYGSGENGHVKTNAVVNINGGRVGHVKNQITNEYCGNVFGAGSGTDTYKDNNNVDQYNPKAGIVYGNTTVNVKGGWVMRNVYGGGEMASVGTVSNSKATSLISWPVAFDYKDANNVDTTGVATVHITGGRVGVTGKHYEGDDEYDNGDVYGASKGKALPSNVAVYLANVKKTIVTIDYASTPNAQNYLSHNDTLAANVVGCIAGAVYGGGENGHVNDSTSITLNQGLVGHAIYGGGKGKDKYQGDYSITAGKVYGNTHININNGYVVRSVFGGGNLASVGKGNYIGDSYNTGATGYGEVCTNADTLAIIAESGHTYLNLYGGTLGILNPSDPTSVFKDNVPYGSVFGGCRGKVVSGNTDLFGFVNYTHVKVGRNTSSAGPQIYGSVFGGAQDGHVRWNTDVEMNSGEIGVQYKASTASTVMGVSDSTNVNWTSRGNIFGGGSGMGTYKVSNVEHYNPIAGSVMQKTQVTINGGTINRDVYGGGDLASVGPQLYGSTDCPSTLTSATVDINAPVGRSDGQYGGHVFGGSRGLPSNEFEFEDFAFVSYTTVNINAGATANVVYGGGENGQIGLVNATSTDHNTVVNINEGLVRHTVYGGGQGVYGESGYGNDSVSGFIMGSTYVNLDGGTVGNVFGGSRRANIQANTNVKVGREVSTGVYSGDVTITGNVYGANNYNGSPFGNVYVDIYKTHQDYFPYDLPEGYTEWNAAALHANGATQQYAIKQVFGGGNRANYLPKANRAYSGKTATVYVHGCHNTIEEVYGGANAADIGTTALTANTDLTIDGGRIHKVFGGGNGEVQAANTYGKASTLIDGGLIDIAYGGGNVSGSVLETDLQVHEGACFLFVDSIFGGSNEAPITGDIVTTLACGNGTYENVYGGANNATINGSVTLNVYGNNITNLFGGSKGTPGEPGADITGNVTLNIYGGTIKNAFGGSDENGNISGIVTVNVLDAEDTQCPLNLDYVYGGSNNTGIVSTSGNDTIKVNIVNGTVNNDVFGGSKGVTAPTTSNPVVNMGYVAGMASMIPSTYTIAPANYKALVKGNIYGGGSLASTTGTTTVNINNGVVGEVNYTASAVTHTQNTSGEYTGKVFGGGMGSTDNAATACVNGNTIVNMKGGQVLYSVYGGGQLASVSDTAFVNITGGSVGPAPKVETGYNVPIGLSGSDGYVFGGGQGIGDDPIDYVNHPYGAYYQHANVGTTYVTVKMDDPVTQIDSVTNRIWGSVFGGAEDGHVTGNTHVNYISGLMGTNGTTSYDGNIFGGGRNYQKKNYTAGRVGGNVYVTMAGGQILGSIFGGGRLGLVGLGETGPTLNDEGYVHAMQDGDHGNIKVVVKGGKVGNEKLITTWTKSSMGDVYGGGKGDMVGVENSPAASALLVSLSKNTEIIVKDSINNGTVVSRPVIYGSVFGGGEVASVGNYTWHQSGASGLEISDIGLRDNSGLAKITVSGGIIGVDNMQMRYELSDDPNHPYNLKYKDDLGHVVGGGEGIVANPGSYATVNPGTSGHNNVSLLDLMATVGRTEVTIADSAFVKGSVYGGSMNGHVLHDALVTVSGGQVGCGEGLNRRYTENEFANSASLRECPHWDYDDGNGNFYPFDPLYVKAGKTPSDGQSWFGNVFGGGSGYYPYVTQSSTNTDSLVWNPNAGLVEGNSKVVITGGHILTSVYGGGEVNDVRGDSTIVLMSGGTIGVPRDSMDIVSHPVTCYLFGSGKGDPRVNFNTYTNVNNVRVEVSGGGKVFGSVFGGGEEGHVLANVKLTVKDNAEIGTFGYTGVDGNVFGAGRGFTADALTAGTVGGNVDVNIKGGEILGSVYGGGRLASVGTYLVPVNDPNYGMIRPDEGGKTYGYTNVNISGGVIGNDYEALYHTDFDKHTKGGNVFGGSMGGLTKPNGDVTPIWAFLGRAKQTKVTITGGTIKSSVYGGGELGTVKDSATVVIKDGIIWRDVFGGGYGSDSIKRLTASIPNQTINASPMQMAGLVGGNTLVKLEGGWVKKSVYGGGELASVGTVTDSIRHNEGTHPFYLSWPYKFTYASNTGNANVQVKGGRVGITGKDYMGPYLANGVTPVYDPSSQEYDDARSDNGDIYGGSKGKAGPAYLMAHSGNVNNAIINIGYLVNDATPENYKDFSTDTVNCIAGAVYGGSEDGHVYDNTNITLTKGLVGHAIYGGGKGKGKYNDETNTKVYGINSGKVYGNTHININPANNDEVYVIRSVFGGGNLASVGIGNYAGGEFDTVYIKDNYFGELVTNADDWSYVRNSGHTYVNIYGGNLGILNAAEPNEAFKDNIPYGSVFGGCRGMAVDSEKTRFGFVNFTHVTIGNGTGGPKILGSVYGGAQDGLVRWHANTVVNNGEIGVNYADSTAAATVMGVANPDTVYWVMRGNVFGGGAGLGLVYENDPASFNHISGQVIQRAAVTINGGTIHRNVYGGGNLATVGPPRNGEHDCPATLSGTKVTINSGANIGANTSNVYGGYVYGGSRGLPNPDAVTTGAPYKDFALCSHTVVNIDNENIHKNVYGGGENGQVGTPHQTDELIHTTTVNINGNSQIAGSVFGGGQGIWGTDDYLHDTISGRVIGTTTVNLNGGRVYGSAYGGGQLGVTYGETYANVSGATVDENVFGGAYGHQGYIHVLGLRTVNMRAGEVKGRVYGGSFFAEDARVFKPVAFANNNCTDPVSVVNFSGGHAYKQVFGAGDHGHTYGSSYVFVGTNAIMNAPNHTATGTYNTAYFDAHDNLIIDGDVYAGADFGDYEQQGAVFGDYTITGRSHIYVDGRGYDTQKNAPETGDTDFMYLRRSLFGCGTLNDGGHQGKKIVVREYGHDITHLPSDIDPEPLINTTRIFQAIQYADTLIVEASHIRMNGRGMVNENNASKEFAIYNIFEDVHVLNGSSLIADKPIDNIGNLYSEISSNYVNGNYPSNPILTEVSYADLIPNVSQQEEEETKDNKIRLNKGGYMSVSITAPNEHNVPVTYYGALKGFFHLMTDGVYNAFAYARPKQSTLEGNQIQEQYNYAYDGGFVSYRDTVNIFDMYGGKVNTGGIQMPYENHAPKPNSKHSNETYFRIWRFKENAASVLDVWLIAEAQPNTSGYHTYIPSDMVKLPPQAGTNAYYRIKRTNDATPIAEINYGTEIKMVNAGINKPNGTKWLYYDNTDHEFKIDTGGTNTSSQKSFMARFPNNAFGLTAIPTGAFTGGAKNDTVLVCSEANKGLTIDTLWRFQDATQSPEVQFMLTHSDLVNGNFTWDPISITFEQVMDDQVVDEVTVYVHVVTKTRIEMPNNVKTYAMMTHAKGTTGDKHDIYKAKVMLPSFQMHDGNGVATWYLTKVEWQPNDTTPQNYPDDFDDGTLVECDTYLNYTPNTRNYVGMKFYPTANVDGVIGWDNVPSSIPPVDLGLKKYNSSTNSNPLITAIDPNGYYLGISRGNDPVSFDFDLHYDSDQNVGKEGNINMGRVVLTVHFDNYKNGDANNNYGQDVTFNVDIIRRGKGKGFYIDGVNGDVLFSGHYPDAAQPSLAGLLYFAPDYEPVDSIFIVNKVTANAVTNLEWNTRYNELRMFRYPGGHELYQDETGSVSSECYMDYLSTYPGNPAYKGALVEVKSSMTVSSATIYGSYNLPEMAGNYGPIGNHYPQVTMADHVMANGPLFEVGPGATLSIDGENHKTQLQYNYNRSTHGGAINVADGGTVKMRRNAHLENNYVCDSVKNDAKGLVVNEPHYGGGIYLTGSATLVASDSVRVDNNYRVTLKKAGTTDSIIAQNAYLNDYNTVITLGTMDGQYVGLTTGKSKIGVTKTAWDDYEYMPVVYSDNQALWSNLLSDGFYDNSHIVFDQQERYGLLEYPFREWNGDANAYNKLYWVRTWTDVVTEAPGGNDYDPMDINTPEKLAWAISLVNGLNGQTKHQGQDFKLTADIDMSDYIWVPIGLAADDPADDASYYGDFDGNGHLVTGIKSMLPSTNKGVFGTIYKNDANTKFANIHDLQVKVDFYCGQNQTVNLGGLVGLMNAGTISNCESGGYLENDYDGIGSIGGLVGKTITATFIHSSFATDSINASRPGNHLYVGGLVGNMGGGELYNSYSRILLDTRNETDSIGGLVGYNGGKVENCYADISDQNFPALVYTNASGGKVYNSYANKKATNVYWHKDLSTSGMTSGITGYGTFDEVLGRKDIGYMYYDNQVDLDPSTTTNTYVVDEISYKEGSTSVGHITQWPGLVSALNEWVKEKNAITDPNNSLYGRNFASWYRPTSAEINSDLPVLAFPTANAMATLDSDGRFLRYNSELDSLLVNFANTEASIFLYGDAVEVDTVPTAKVKVYVNEDATLTQKAGASKFINTTVGVTFDNSSKAANDYFNNQLYYDWHLMSTPLSDAKMGTTYGKVYPDNQALVENGNYIPHTGNDVYYQTDSVDVVSMVNSYFPNGLKMGAGYNDDVKWDFYNYFEPEYHWINLKRNKNNHFHRDALENPLNPELTNRPFQADINNGYPHYQINYTGTDQSATPAGDSAAVFTPAKGYMMAISKDSYMSSTGTLNKDTVNIAVTAQAIPDIQGTSTDRGSNLVGNPYQAYLDLDKVSTSEYNSTLNKFWTYDADLNLYAPYTTDASANPTIPSRFVHPHQGFFVVTASDDVMTFNPGMASTKPTGDVNAYFRGDEKPRYPLVNLFVTDEDGNRDLTIVEFNRPMDGGVPKIDNLRNADFTMYAHLSNQDYGLLFTPVGTERVPVFFKTPNDGSYTINWDKHHGNFTTLRLIDNIAGVDYDMLANDHYTFEAHATDFAARFYIVFGVTDVEEHDDDNDVLAFFNGYGWVVNGTGQLELVDMLGHVLYAKHLDGKPTMVHFDDVAAGMYMLRLVDSKKVLKAQKIVIY